MRLWCVKKYVIKIELVVCLGIYNNKTIDCMDVDYNQRMFYVIVYSSTPRL